MCSGELGGGQVVASTPNREKAEDETKLSRHCKLAGTLANKTFISLEVSMFLPDLVCESQSQVSAAVDVRPPPLLVSPSSLSHTYNILISVTAGHGSQ